MAALTIWVRESRHSLTKKWVSVSGVAARNRPVELQRGAPGPRASRGTESVRRW